MAPMDSWLYAAVCLVVPALWGLSMYALFGAWERRKKPGELPPIDYSI